LKIFNGNFELFGENGMKVITTGHILISKYELSRFSKKEVNFDEFLFLGTKIKLKFKILGNLELEF
jgi:hypothetical protein